MQRRIVAKTFNPLPIKVIYNVRHMCSVSLKKPCKGLGYLGLHVEKIFRKPSNIPCIRFYIKRCSDKRAQAYFKYFLLV